MFDTKARERAAGGINGALVFADAETQDYIIVIYQVDDARHTRAYLTLDRYTKRECELVYRRSRSGSLWSDDCV